MNQKYVLKKNEEINALVKKKNSVGNKYYAIYYDKQENNDVKVAISVSKKNGSAPVRNYEKRVVREIIRTKWLDQLKGYRCLIIVKKEVLNLTFIDKEKELENVIKKMLNK